MLVVAETEPSLLSVTVPALVGAGVAGILTLLSTAYRNRSERQREREHWRLDQRLRSYARLTAALSSASTEAGLLWTGFKAKSDDATLRELDRVHSAQAEVEILGPNDVSATSARAVKAVVDLVALGTKHRGNDAKQAELIGEVNTTRSAFVAAARAIIEP